METKTTFEITEERAIAMLSNNASIAKERVPYSGVEVRNVSYFNPQTGEVWTYDDGTEYAIVNLKAQTPYQQEQSLDLFQQGDYTGAVNQTLSISMNPALAADVEAVGVGTLTTAKILSNNKTDENGDPLEITIAKRFVPAKAVESKAIDFAELLKKAAAATDAPTEGEA